jgi:hypothetical protein
MPIDGVLLLLAFLVVLGAAIQGAVGFGFPYLLAPLAIFVLPDMIPGPVLLLTLLINSDIAIRERGNVVLREVGWLTVGRLGGALLAGAAFGAIDPDLYKLVIGGVLLCAVALTALAKVATVRRTVTSMTISGIAAGVMGTLTGVGGPALALLYQGEEPSRIRGVLSVSLLLGVLISIASLWIFGHFGARDFELAGWFLVPTILGIAGGRWLARRIDRRRARVAILIITTIAAAGPILDALFR